MKSTDERIILYQKVGLLFYAIAAADNTVRPEEKSQLRKLLRVKANDLLDLTKQINVDAFSQILVSFELAELKKRSPEECMNEFIQYYKENDYLVTNDLKDFLWSISNKIATAVSGFNKSELIKLSQLKILLKDNGNK